MAAELLVPVDVVIDFSVPKAAEAIIETCRQKKLPLVVATTGFEPKQVEQLRAAAAEIPLLWSPSMSLSVNLAMKLCELAGHALADKDADVEIIERHHRFKEDSPSGTALKFGEIIAAEMGQTKHVHGRSGRPGKRPHHEIGYPRHPRRRQSGRAYDRLRHARRDVGIDRAGQQSRLLRPRRVGRGHVSCRQTARAVWDEGRAGVIIGV